MVSLNSPVVRDSVGAVIHYIWTIEDISELKANELALSQYQQ